MVLVGYFRAAPWRAGGGVFWVFGVCLFGSIGGAGAGGLPFWCLFSWGLAWLEVGLGCVVLSPAGMGVMFGIGASGGAGLGGICVGGWVALRSLAFAGRIMKGTI